MSKNPYEVIVIGAGIMGSTTAYYLSKHYGGNSKILLLEQFNFLHRRGSSHGESRIIRRTYNEEYYTFLTEDAYKLWREAEEEAKVKILSMTGGLDFGKPDNPLITSTIRNCKKYNVAHEVMTPEEVKTRFPMVNCPQDFIAVYSPDCGILSATKAVGMFQSLAASSGCDLRDNCGIVAMEEINEPTEMLKIITNTGEEFLTKNCVIVAGPWTGKLLKKCFNLEVPLKVVQASVAYWKVDKPEDYLSNTFPIFISHDEPLVYGTPIQEHSNLIKCCPDSAPPEYCDPDDCDFQPRADLFETRAKPFLKTFFTGVNLSPELTETCLLTESPDGDYIIDHIPSNKNILFGCGFSGHGFKLGVVVGKILSELAMNHAHPYPSVEKYFKLSRFDKPEK